MLQSQDHAWSLANGSVPSKVQLVLYNELVKGCRVQHQHQISAKKFNFDFKTFLP